MRKLKTKRKFDYPFIEHKVTPKEVPYIGFEWEVHGMRYDSFKRKRQASIVKGSGFHFHPEFGTEFCSPVASTISQARGAAKFIIDKVKKSKVGCNPDVDGHLSGIHVTVSPSFENQKKISTYLSLCATINHSSFEDFIWSLSGRTERVSYYQQAQVGCWDLGTNKKFYRNGWDFYPSMIKFQDSRGNGAYEFRIWSGKTDRLIPAIEFTHSYYRFIMKDFKTFPSYRGELLYGTIPDSFKERTKTFEQYRDWLFKQDGYKTLKKDEAFNI